MQCATVRKVRKARKPNVPLGSYHVGVVASPPSTGEKRPLSSFGSNFQINGTLRTRSLAKCGWHSSSNKSSTVKTSIAQGAGQPRVKTTHDAAEPHRFYRGTRSKGTP